MGPVTTESKCISRATLGLLIIGCMTILVTLVSVVLPQHWANPEHLLSASMLMGIASALTHFLSPEKQISVLDIRGGKLLYRSHKNPISGIAFGTTYGQPAELDLSHISAIELRTVEVPNAGAFCLVVLNRNRPSETSIWFESKLFPAVKRILKSIHTQRSDITFKVI